MQLGPLGTALLPASRPSALLVDEIDKSDLDLASDLLDVLERGEFEIPELARNNDNETAIRKWNSHDSHPVVQGRVRCEQFPFIVMTSNGERDFPAPFLRRCIRYTMPRPTPAMLQEVIRAHLDLDAATEPIAQLVDEFLTRLDQGESVAVDQLLNAVFLISGHDIPDRSEITARLMQDLSHG
jgi:MoxR-like ATPase